MIKEALFSEVKSSIQHCLKTKYHIFCFLCCVSEQDGISAFSWATKDFKRSKWGRIWFPIHLNKLDGVGPVDNRPSSNKLYHCVRRKKNVTCDMWHMTRDTWQVTHDTFGGVNILSKFHLPSFYRLWFLILWRSGGKGWLSDLMN